MRRGSRIVALMLGATLIAGWGASHLEHTEAAWSDRETANATLAARKLERPTISSCSIDPNLLALTAVITVVWSFPPGYNYVQGTNNRFTLQRNAGSPAVVTPAIGPQTGGSITTKWTTGLLSSTLGATFYITLQSVEPVAQATTWTSDPATATATIAALGASTSCVAT